MDTNKIKELTYTIDFLAASVEALEERCLKHYEISNLLVLIAETI